VLGTKDGQAATLSSTLEILERKAKDTSRWLAISSALDPVFELEDNARSRLEKSTQDLRLSRLLASMDRFNTREISFSSTALGKSPVLWKQQEGKWTTTAAGGSAGADKIAGILDRLSGNRIQSFTPHLKHSTDELQITLKNEAGATLRQLGFWREGGKLFARDLLSKRAETFELDPALASGLPWDSSFFSGPSPGTGTGASASAQPGRHS